MPAEPEEEKPHRKEVKEAHREKAHLDRVYVDATSPFEIPSHEGHRYAIGFVDGFSGYGWVYMVATLNTWLLHSSVS